MFRLPAPQRPQRRPGLGQDVVRGRPLGPWGGGGQLPGRGFPALPGGGFTMPPNMPRLGPFRPGAGGPNARPFPGGGLGGLIPMPGGPGGGRFTPMPMPGGLQPMPYPGGGGGGYQPMPFPGGGGGGFIPLPRPNFGGYQPYTPPVAPLPPPGGRYQFY